MNWVNFCNNIYPTNYVFWVPKMKKNLRTFWVLIFVSILALMALKYSFNLSLYGLLVSLGWIIALITVVGILSLFAGWLIHFFKNDRWYFHLGWSHILWIAKATMAADTATFNDSIPFINGMLIVPVASFTSSSDIPFDSLPRMNTLVFF